MNNTILAIFLGLIGMCIASFLHTLVFRIEKGSELRALLFESSNCDRCKKNIPWYALIPFFGYLFIGGKCIHCKAKIPFIYPISELFLGASFGAFAYCDVQAEFYVILAFLFFMSFFDINSRSIPRKVVHLFLILSLLVTIEIFVANQFYYGTDFFTAKFFSLSATMIVVVIMMLLNIFKKSFGFGDVLILLGLGIFLNKFMILLVLFVTLLVSLIYIIIMLLFKKITLKSYIPLIPFISIGYVISLILTNCGYDYWDIGFLFM
ncbi:MAG TPA: prepilin peptidase [Candidatus Dojkabacteria bacterium]|nr:prepilin peptidase [Candidatus Dojkabacteria bacterium]